MKKKFLIPMLALSLSALALTACGEGKKEEGKKAESKEDGVNQFTAFFSVQGAEINDDNEIQEIIAKKTGAKVKETWLTGQTAEEAIGTMIAGGDYPDFIDGGSNSVQLYQAGALVPLDDYLDKYPNIKNFLTEEDWDKLRQDDGHIYWIPQFSNIRNAESGTVHNDEAFWIQARVLEWAGYPQIKTMDQYFDIIEGYLKEHPTMEDGTPNVGYTILAEGWRSFGLDNAPLFLDGYPNDGSCIVNPKTVKVEDYNTTETAKAYYKKLNEEYKKGIVDPESFTQTYDEYIAKLSTGRVLGMIDQWWNFAYTAGDAIKQAKLDEQGCSYIPVPVTINENVKNQWHTSGGLLNVSGGLAVTVSCEDVEGALEFVNNMLTEEIQVLRYWGVEGTDYNVDDKGMFTRTEEQRVQAADTAYKASHLCTYSYFPQWDGTLDDGINATKSEAQPSEFYDSLGKDVKKAFDAYGIKTYVEMLGTNEKPGPWYPMWSFGQTLTSQTPGGVANVKITDVKDQYLPRLIMSDDYEGSWNEYMVAYNASNPQDYLDELQTELDKRVKDAAKYK